MTETRRLRVRDALPRSRLFWGLEATGLVLVLVGATLARGEMAGLLGIWGLSLVVGTAGLFAAYRFWQDG